MYTIFKQFTFSASHQLDHLPTGHQCSRLHGHNYTVEIELQAETLDSNDFVLDYGELSAFKWLIDSQLDHRHLNDVLPVRSTAENLARWLFEQAEALYVAPAFRAHHPRIVAVRVRETDKTCAEYRP